MRPQKIHDDERIEEIEKIIERRLFNFSKKKMSSKQGFFP